MVIRRRSPPVTGLTVSCAAGEAELKGFQTRLSGFGSMRKPTAHNGIWWWDNAGIKRLMSRITLTMAD